MPELNLDDLTLEQIKEQLALYNRLYYKKRRNDKDFMEAKKQSALRHYRRKQVDKMVENGDIEIKMKKATKETTETKNSKPTKHQKYKIEALKIITEVNE